MAGNYAVHIMHSTQIDRKKIVRYVYGMHLSDYMARNGLNDETVAIAINRSRVSVNRYRRRLKRPDWETIQAIREYTGGKVRSEDWQLETTA